MGYIVGVLPLYDEKKESIWMLPHYLEMLERNNLVPFIFPYTTNMEVINALLPFVDGILFTGGHDIHPGYYGEDKRVLCGETLQKRDELEHYLFEKAIETDIPILGICRGLQLFNVLQGGTLYQDLPSEFDSLLKHHQSIPYEQSVHSVTFLEGSLFHQWCSETVYHVNSIHHQAIKELAPQTEVLAVSEDGLVEGIRLNNISFGIAVQWHPEYMIKTDSFTNRLMTEFYDACLNYNGLKLR